MSILNRKIDDAFLEALNSSDDLAEAIAKWAGVSPAVAEDIAADVTAEMLELLQDRNRQGVEVAVLRMLKPDATLKDYLILRSFSSFAIAFGMNECLEHVKQSEVGIEELIRPAPGEQSIALISPELTVIVKGEREAVGQVLLLWRELTGAIDNLKSAEDSVQRRDE